MINTKKIISQSGCFFHPDRPPVIYQVDIGKVGEKADLFQKQHLPCLAELPPSQYLVQVDTSTDLST